MRWECECGHVCTEDEMDRVVDPRPRPGEPATTWLVCPACRTPENWQAICDEPGCARHVSCGTPTPAGYRNICHQHQPK